MMRHEDKADRRNNNRPLAMGTALSAGFLGFLVHAATRSAAAATPAEEGGANPVYGEATTRPDLAMGLAEDPAPTSFLNFTGNISAARPAARADTTAFSFDGNDAGQGLEESKAAFGIGAPIVSPTEGGETVQPAGGPDTSVASSSEPVNITFSAAPVSFLTTGLLAGDGQDGGIAPEPYTGPYSAVLSGTQGDDVISGTDANEEIFGGGGHDIIDGGGGNDSIDGGAGDDVLHGGAGDDRLMGGDGNDFLDGGAGQNMLYGGPGDDMMVIHKVGDLTFEEPGEGRDTVVVNDGFAADLDMLAGHSFPGGITTFTMGSAVGTALPDAAGGFVQSIDPDIENIVILDRADHNVVAGDTDNHIFAGDGNNQVWAGDGDDLVDGMSGDDLIYGEDGDDLLAGGDGYDMLFGGEGDDTFLFGLSDSAVDTVFDHQGSNIIEIADAQSDRLGKRMDGDDLILTHDGADIVRIDQYAGHEAAFDGVRTGGDGGFSLMRNIPDDAGSSATTADMTYTTAGSTPATGLAEASGSEDFSWNSPQQASDDLLQGFMSHAVDGFSGEADILADYMGDTPVHRNSHD
ncbi:MAG: hypothetical protein H6851_14385 [Geminicoccaceae bacterium]|nr:hypothetical protein [Geminicoccaceae bacterium]